MLRLSHGAWFSRSIDSRTDHTASGVTLTALRVKHPPRMGSATSPRLAERVGCAMTGVSLGGTSARPRQLC